MLALCFALLLSCTPSALLDFAMPIWSRPNSTVEIDDAYKWLYQATRGGEHAAPERGMAEKWLANEWTSVGPPRPGESLWEPLCADGSIGRLNIRPFKARRGSQAELLEAFLESGRSYRGEASDFLAVWNELGRRLEQKRFGKMSARRWTELDQRMKIKDYPAIHHSKPYAEAVQPAYRILTLRAMQAILEN